MSNFHPLDVVDRGSETQLQVGENFNLNNLIYRLKAIAGDINIITLCIAYILIIVCTILV